MGNQFFTAMSERSDEELNKIVTEQRNDYRPEAVEAAEREIYERTNQREKFSKIPNDELLTLLISAQEGTATKELNLFAIAAAREEAKKRNLNFEIENNLNETESNYELNNTRNNVKIKYPALRFISSFYTFLAWVSALGTIMAILYIVTQNTIETIYAAVVFFGGGILFITFLALAEGIMVFIDIEHNTRISSLNNRK